MSSSLALLFYIPFPPLSHWRVLPLPTSPSYSPNSHFIWPNQIIPIVLCSPPFDPLCDGVEVMSLLCVERPHTFHLTIYSRWPYSIPHTPTHWVVMEDGVLLLWPGGICYHKWVQWWWWTFVVFVVWRYRSTRYLSHLFAPLHYSGQVEMDEQGRRCLVGGGQGRPSLSPQWVICPHCYLHHLLLSVRWRSFDRPWCPSCSPSFSHWPPHIAGGCWHCCPFPPLFPICPHLSPTLWPLWYLHLCCWEEALLFYPIWPHLHCCSSLLHCVVFVQNPHYLVHSWVDICICIWPWWNIPFIALLLLLCCYCHLYICPIL